MNVKHLASVLMDAVKREVIRTGMMNTDSPNKKAQEKTESEEDCSLENLGMKAGLLLIIPKYHFLFRRQLRDMGKFKDQWGILLF